MKTHGLSILDIQSKTLADEIKFWIQRRSLELAPASVNRAKRIIHNELIPRFATLNLMKISKSQLYTFQSELLEKELEPRTINKVVGTLIAILNYSVEKQRLPYNPVAGFRPLKAVSHDMGFWEESEARRFLEFANRKYAAGAEKRWVYVVYLLSLNTGLRAGETWGLKPADIAANGELLHISRQLDRDSRGFCPTKGKADRYVPCHKVLLEELNALIKSQRIKADETIFLSCNGNSIEHNSFRKNYFLKDMKLAGVPEIRFHDLRHTAGTLMVSKGIDLPTVQAILGHQDVQTTMRYVHLLGSSIRAAALKFSLVPEENVLPFDASKVARHPSVIHFA